MPKQPDESTIKQIRADLDSGMNVNAVAEKHSLAWGTVKKYAGSANGAKPGRRRKAVLVPTAHNFEAILAELRTRRDKLSEVIATLETF